MRRVAYVSILTLSILPGIALVPSATKADDKFISGPRDSAVSSEESTSLEADTVRRNTAGARARMEGEKENLTVEAQSNRPERIEVTRQIRQRLVENDNLSTTAQNIAVITTDDGHVTLRGEVETNNEKNTVAEIAKTVAGNANVHNELRVEREQ